MKIILLTTALALALVVRAVDDDEWKRYKEEYNKVYTSAEEDMRRLEQYRKTKETIEEHNRKYNRGETRYTMGINKFADWYPEELRSLYGSMPETPKPVGGMKFELPPGTPVPDSINWVKKGAVTSVKDQGKCNAGYAFSAVGALEALMFITNNTITDLSAQELLDCSEHASCDAGYAFLTYLFVQTNGGIDSDKSYPYSGKKQICKANGGTIVSTCNGFGFINSEGIARDAVGTVGPVSIKFDLTSDFLKYSGGIFDGDCNKVIDKHSMLIVGYGKDEKTKEDYWLLKNSWGTKWGQNGYVKMKRGVNLCGMSNLVTFPLFF